MAVAIIAVISFFATFITFLVLHYKTRNRERMALVEKGESAKIFVNEGNNLGALKFGILLVSAGAGFLLGFFFERIFDAPEALLPITMGIMFGGLGLILFYFMARRIKNGDDYSDTI